MPRNRGPSHAPRGRTPRISTSYDNENSAFSSLAIKALDKSREEAVRLKHSHVGSEHLLLGMLLVRGCAGLKIIKHLKIKPALIRKAVMEMVVVGTTTGLSPDSLQYSEHTRQVLAEARYQTRFLGEDNRKVGTEYLLLGLVMTKDGIASQALTKVIGDNAENKIRMSILGLNGLYAQ
jgi:ATP-dependent Clp protease ATP-binding subunit ClpC